ncbi:MAG: hydrogenase maturation protease [Acidobacteriota bacterium]
MKPQVLIAGIGNIFQGDDGFGVEVAQRLMRRTLPPEVRVTDFGIRGFDLAYALMDQHDCTILVDAVSRGEDPGTLYVIEPDLDDVSETELNAHAMNPQNVFALVKSMGGQCKRVLLVGCEPKDLGGDEGKMGLTDEVSAAVEAAADLTVSLATEMLQNQERQIKEIV